MPSFRISLALADVALPITMLASVPALAATTMVDVGPAATTRNVRQVRMRFSDDIIALGDNRPRDSTTVTCSDPGLKAVGYAEVRLVTIGILYMSTHFTD